jgi:hypothetical protein
VWRPAFASAAMVPSAVTVGANTSLSTPQAGWTFVHPRYPSQSAPFLEGLQALFPAEFALSLTTNG